jgi:16S rRNA U516 pseudouridylate synthase RsuA-like enzyme
MLQNHGVSDKDLLKLVTQRLARTAIASQTPISAMVRNGNVTLSGAINFEFQRKMALKAVQGIHGVRHVVDQLRVQPATKKWQATHGPGHVVATHAAPPHSSETSTPAPQAEVHPAEPPSSP